jgi:hypothetical protein
MTSSIKARGGSLAKIRRLSIAAVWEMLHVAHVFEQAGEFDLIHNQADFVPLAFSRLVRTPMVTTIHGFSSERILLFNLCLHNCWKTISMHVGSRSIWS